MSTTKVIPFASKAGLTFGIYPGGVMEEQEVLATGKPDQPDQVNRALDRLQNGKHFLVRTYLRFSGSRGLSNSDAESDFMNMPSVSDLARYTWNGRKLDLVLSNRDSTGDLSQWARFVERAIDRYGEYAQYLQICEEPNLYDYPGDGRFEHRAQAVITGIKAARARIAERGLALSVGFNSVPSFNLNDGFWCELAAKIDASFLRSLDYVGLNLYPDVAEPVRGRVEYAVEETLIHFRETTLALSRIPLSVPIRVCENGWPTGPQRYYTRQADVLEQVVRKVFDLRVRLNITGFGLFSLRDADTANPDISGQFGIMRDDYSPKPAFETYRALIQEMGN